MKKAFSLTAITLAALLGHSAVEASTVSQTDPQVGGIGYRWTVVMGINDSAALSRHVGAWAWQDSALFDPGETPVGWTHNSEWVALKLELPSLVTLRLENVAGIPNPTSQNPSALAPDNLYPGMTIYSGWDNDLAPQAFADANNEGLPTNNWHSYSNRGNVDWAEDTQYFSHLEPNGTHVIEATLLMPAGDYTLAIGGQSIATGNEPRQGYLASFSTTPVPEPGSTSLALLGSLALLCKRRRQNARRQP
ncbi:MAG: PEP-CTERM sorting domain-containing protein [Verrucomicrobiota bacterium]